MLTFAVELRSKLPETDGAGWKYLCAIQDALKHRAEVDDVGYCEPAWSLEKQAESDRKAGQSIDCNYFLDGVPEEKRLLSNRRSKAEREYAVQLARQEQEYEEQEYEKRITCPEEGNHK